MDRKGKFGMVAATFVLAAAAGQYMQSGDAAATAALAPRAVPRPAVAAVAPAAMAMPAVPELAHVTPVSFTLAADASDADRIAAAAPDCRPRITLDPAPGAMLALRLLAPCSAGERVVVQSNGLSFTGQTDAAGRLALALPAMHDPAVVTVRLPGGARASATAAVPELAELHRVALQWVAPDAFRLAALQFGAAYGSAGEVSAARPGQPAAPAEATGGFLTELGDAEGLRPMRAEVYTVPRALTRAGKVAVTVEAPVTLATCGRKLHGQFLVVGRSEPTEVVLAMPACGGGAIGQAVALTGLAPDFVVAAR